MNKETTQPKDYAPRGLDNETSSASAALMDIARSRATEWPRANDDGELVDARGVPWIEDIHSVNKTCSDDGTWRRKRGVHKHSAAAAEAEYLNAKEMASDDREVVQDDPWEDDKSRVEQPGPGYPQIRSAIDRAKTLEMCDEAEDLLRCFYGREDLASALAEHLDSTRARINAELLAEAGQK